MVQLDVLRGIAILLVLGSHYVIGPKQAGWLRIPATLLARFGWTGVDLFFVLSGFLVGGLLMRELRLYGKLDVRRFLIRRGFKIWPIYYLYLLVLGIMMLAGVSRPPEPLYQLLSPNLVHLQNYNIWHMPYDGSPIAGHTWSLAVEEHFYLLLPLLLLFIGRSGKRGLAWIPWIAIGLDVICLALRLRLTGEPYRPWTQQTPTHLRIDSLFTGVLLAYWYHFQPEFFARLTRHRLILVVCGLLLVSPMAVLPLEEKPFVSTYGFTLLSVGYACLLLACVSTPIGEGRMGHWFASRTARALAAVGAFSYSIYIWHIDLVTIPIQRLVKFGLLSGLPSSARWIVLTLAYSLAAILVGGVLGWLCERPTLLLRDALFPSRSDALGLQTGGIEAPESLPDR